jgi:hypothetical protein
MIPRLRQSVAARVEFFGMGEKGGETVTQTRAACQIDAPELNFAGLEWRKDIDLFPITQHKRYRDS